MKQDHISRNSSANFSATVLWKTADFGEGGGVKSTAMRCRRSGLSKSIGVRFFCSSSIVAKSAKFTAKVRGQIANYFPGVPGRGKRLDFCVLARVERIENPGATARFFRCGGLTGLLYTVGHAPDADFRTGYDRRNRPGTVHHAEFEYHG